MGRFLAFHRERKASVTIGMIPVAPEETRHFGTATLDKNRKIVDWQEKAAKARSNLASMGIYVFDRQYLTANPDEDQGRGFWGSRLSPGP